MMRSPHPTERSVLRLLLLALMGLALASRLALGASLPVAMSADGARAADPVALLQAAMVMCHAGHGREPQPAPAPLRTDLLLFDLADNAHALPSAPAAASPPALGWSAVEYPSVQASRQAPLRRTTQRARGPPLVG